MQRPRRPFEIALLALYLAIGLPLVVVMFGSIRTRQLQSKANPRWAQFAKVTGPAATGEPAGEESNRLVIRTASIVSESRTEHSTSNQSMTDSDLTGSVTGHLSLDVPVQSAREPLTSSHLEAERSPTTASLQEHIVSQHAHEAHRREVKSRVEPAPAPDTSSVSDESSPSVPCVTVVHTPIIFRPLDEDLEPPVQANPSSVQMQAHLTEVRKRLDQLAQQQQQQHAEQVEREARLLKALTELRHVAKVESQVEHVDHGKAPIPDPEQDFAVQPKVRQTTPVESTPDAAPAKAADEPAAPAVPAEQSSAVTNPQVPALQPATTPLPAIVSPPQESAITIRRESQDPASSVFTMEAKDADIREFFVKLSESAQVSILPSPEVNGRISLKLHSVPFEPALRAILKSRNYVYERDGDIVLISTADEAARLKQSNRQLFVKIYQPSYLSSVQLARLIEPLLSPDGRYSATTAPNPALLRDDELETNEIQQRDAVVVQDAPEVLSQIDQVLVEMDVPPLQVMIEARILSVRLAGRWEQGIDLGLLPCQLNSSITASACGLKHANLSCNVPSFVKAMERVADTSFVTSQRIQVLNKHRAEMLIGDRIGYQKKSGDSVQFMESGTRLIFRPTISADGCVRLEIHPERNTLKVNRKSKMTHETATELTTHILVHDGTTVAIGGLIAEQMTEPVSANSRKNPLALIGGSPRRRDEVLQRNELVLLVTPHIMTDCPVSQNETQPPASLDHAASTRQQANEAHRRQLAKAHYQRAAIYAQQGNPVRARQQIEASLRLNAADPDSQRLRNEIIQCFSQAAK